MVIVHKGPGHLRLTSLPTNHSSLQFTLSGGLPHVLDTPWRFRPQLSDSVVSCTMPVGAVVRLAAICAWKLFLEYTPRHPALLHDYSSLVDLGDSTAELTTCIKNIYRSIGYVRRSEK